MFLRKTDHSQNSLPGNAERVKFSPAVNAQLCRHLRTGTWLLWAVLGLATCLLVASSCAFAAEPSVTDAPIKWQAFTPVERQQLARLNGELRVGVVANAQPPFALADTSNAFSGLSIDVTREVAAALSLHAVFRSYPDVAAQRGALARGEIDLAAMSTDALIPDTLFSRAWYTEHPVLVTRKAITPAPNENLTTPSQALAYVPGSIDLPTLQALYPHEPLKAYASAMEALQAVAFGQAKGYIGSRLTAGWLVQQLQLGNLQVSAVLPNPLHGEGFATRASDGTLRNLVDAAILALPPGRIAELVTPWDSDWGHGGGPKPVVLTPIEQEWIKQHPQVRFLVQHNSPPFLFRSKQGAAHGMAVDLFAEVTRQTGLQFVAQDSDSPAAANQLLARGLADIDPTGGSTGSQILHTQPYGNWFPVIVSRAGVKIANRQALDGKSVAVVTSPMGAEGAATALAKAKIVKVASVVEAFNLLDKGNVSAVVCDVSVANFLIPRLYAGKLAVNGALEPHPMPVSIAVSARAPELVSILNKVTSSLSAGQVATLRQGWTEQLLPAMASEQIRRELVIAVVVLAIFIAIALVWGLLLYRQISKRDQAEKHLKNQLRFQAALLKGIPTAVYVRDVAGRLVSCNQAFADLLRCSPADLMGCTLDEMRLPASLAQDLNRIYAEVAIQQQRQKFEVTADFGEGLRTLFFEVTPFYDAEDQLAGIVSGGVEITDHIRLEQELRAAKVAADAASNAKSVFLSGMSHEIRTPLNVIIGAFDLQLGASADDGRSRTSASMQAARDAAHHLLGLIDNVLDFSKIDADKMTLVPEPLCLADLTTQMARMYGPLAQQKQLHFHLHADEAACHVMADATRLRQILSNLLSNALKFTTQGGIVLRCRVSEGAQPDLAAVIFEVEDTGIGISPDDQAALFQPFVQATSMPSGGHGGTGLGLSICKRLAAMMNGQVALESTPGLGTRITVSLTLPRAAPPLPRKSSDLALPQRIVFDRLPVLIADDHPSNRLILREQLEQLGCVVTEAQDGAEALKQLAGYPFKVVITDISMPIMDGHQLARAIRKQENTQNALPMVIVGLTAYVQPEVAAAALAAGMNECHVKPLGQQQLGALLAAHFAEEVVLTEEGARPQSQGSAMRTADGKIHPLLLETLVSSLREDLASAQTELTAGDMVALKARAHRMKGPFRMLEWTPFVEACIHLEHATTTSTDPQTWQGELDELNVLAEALFREHTQAVSSSAT
ncbi:two-component system sensor histidine kinase EvgS [Silvimonas terrae]|uniref:Virulence sensor protein BvgS n=1 Tax=Silvimonas terrae TaxID=300266 RepID=A0A840RHN1_9NEIS|nr:transporter substrate-binding domain-containing protein [Silvimonas terrae]MBB5191836.1 two-component system sensor histidine kinase EvgS [Silvimonas terrae]